MRRSRFAAVVLVVAIALVGVGLGAGVAVQSLGGASSGGALGPPHFVEETATAGIVHTYAGDARFATGGGVAVLDCDGDGRPDVYLAGGSGPASLYRNDGAPGGTLHFTRIADPATDLTDVLGAYPIDIDGDGIVDLAVLRLGETVLLRGLGGCRFERANERWGFDGGDAETSAFSATWERDARLPTLALGRFLKLDANGQQTLDCDTNLLLRPDASGSRYGAPIPLAPGYCALSVLFSDWDVSGRQDLRVTNDRNYYIDGQDQLWRVAPGEAPRAYTEAEGWLPLHIMGMGIASRDLTGDGFPEVYLTSQGDNKLQTLAAGPARPTYKDIALERGVTSAQPFTGGDVLTSTAWHPEFGDVNDDGLTDLLVTKGNVDAQPDFAAKDPNDLFIGQPDGTFQEGADAAGILDYDRSRGAALADFDLDGLPDLIVVEYGAPVRIWRNVGAGDAGRPAPMGHWLELRPTQPGPDRDAIGGWLEVKAGDVVQRQEITIGGGHASGELGWLHLGLGAATEAQVRVTWPDGEIGPWLTLPADEFAIIDRATGQATPWTPPKD